MGSKLLVLLGVVALGGCKTVRTVRLTPGNVQDLPDTYEAQWKTAKSLVDVAARSDNNATMRKKAAQDGIAYARRARELKPDGVEGHYYYALSVGCLADVDRSYGLNAVGEMETALKRAGELDEKYDFAGPLRVLGILHLRTPAPPVSIGSPRKGLRLLQRAVELFPDYPENLLYLGEALRDNGQTDEAREALRKVIEAKPVAGHEFESTQSKTEAEKLLKSLPQNHEEKVQK